MSLISIGVASNYRVPNVYLQSLFAQGPATASEPGRKMLVAMPFATGGTAVANTLYRIRNGTEIDAIAGARSPAARACKTVLKAKTGRELWYLAVPQTTGGVPGAADGTIVYASNATATGFTTIKTMGKKFVVKITSGDTPTVIGDAVEAALNADPELPFTAANATGTVTLTAAINGDSMGDNTTGVIRYSAEIDSGLTTTVTTSGAALGLGTGTAGVDGTTTEAAQLATALATVDNVHHYYIVTSTWSATGVANLTAHIAAKADPLVGLRSVGITAFTGALAACTTKAIAQNNERIQIAWQPNSQFDVATLAANMAAIRQKREKFTPFNFDGYRRAEDWFVPGCLDAADRITRDDLNDALNDGITPIATDEIGSYVVMSVNTRSKDSGGTLDDFRATETHRVSIGDEFASVQATTWSKAYDGFQQRDDKKLDDGVTPDPSDIPPPNVITPQWGKVGIQKIYDDFEAAGKLQNTERDKAALELVIDPANTSRMECSLPYQTIDQAHSLTVRAAELSAG